MSEQLGFLIVVDKATGQASVENFGRSVDRVARKASRGLTPLSGAFDGIATKIKSVISLVTGLGTAMATFFVFGQIRQGTEDFFKFERNMATIQARGKVTAAEMKILRGTLEDLGRSTVFSSTELSDAADRYQKAGLSIKEITQALPASISGAVVSGEDLTAVSKGLTDIMGEFRVAFEDADKVMNIMIGTVANTKQDLPDLMNALKFVGPIAVEAGLSLQETATMLGVFANAGIRGTLGGTALRESLARLIAPAGKGKEVLGALNTGLDGLEKGTVNLTTVLMGLKDAGADLTKLFPVFGKRAAAPMITAMNAVGGEIDSLREKIVTFNTEGAAQEIMSGFLGEAFRLRSLWQELSKSFGRLVSILLQAFGPALAGVARVTTAWLESFKRGEAVSNIREFFRTILGLMEDVRTGIVNAMAATLDFPRGVANILRGAARAVVRFVFFVAEQLANLMISVGTSAKILWAQTVQPLLSLIELGFEKLILAIISLFRKGVGTLPSLVAGPFSAMLDAMEANLKETSATLTASLRDPLAGIQEELISSSIITEKALNDLRMKWLEFFKDTERSDIVFELGRDLEGGNLVKMFDDLIERNKHLMSLGPQVTESQKKALAIKDSSLPSKLDLEQAEASRKFGESLAQGLDAGISGTRDVRFFDVLKDKLHEAVGETISLSADITSQIQAEQQQRLVTEVSAFREQLMSLQTIANEEMVLGLQSQSDALNSTNEFFTGALRDREQELFRHTGQFRKLMNEQTLVMLKAGKDQVSVEAAKNRILFAGAQTVFSSLLALSGSSNDRKFRMLKNVAVAEAYVNALAGANQALRSLPFPANTFAAAAVLLEGMARVRQIRATEPGSTSGGTGGGGGALPATLGASLPQGPAFSGSESDREFRVARRTGPSITINMSGVVGDKEEIAATLKDILKDAGSDGVIDIQGRTVA